MYAPLFDAILEFHFMTYSKVPSLLIDLHSFKNTSCTFQVFNEGMVNQFYPPELNLNKAKGGGTVYVLCQV